MKKFIALLGALLLLLAPPANGHSFQKATGFQGSGGPAVILRSKMIVESKIGRYFLSRNRALSSQKAREYARYSFAWGMLYDVDPFLIASVMIVESSLNWKARSPYAHGLMQINWKVHRRDIRRNFPHIANLKDLYRPRNNILVGTWLLHRYLQKTGGNVSRALWRYLGTNSKRYSGIVLKHYRAMKPLHGSHIK